MHGFALGMALLVSSTGLSPACEPSIATVVPAVFTFDLPADTASSRNPSHRLQNEPSRPQWWRAPSQPAKATTAKRFSKTGRIIVVAAGAFGGWMAGGGIGYVATSKPGDDVSGLRGVMIGAPIGAVVGAVIGYRLTR